jgi:hypothetical protein
MIPPFERNDFNNAVAKGQIVWRKHVLVRLLERSIAQSAVLECACFGECIQAYFDDTPLPSALFLAFVNNEPLHTVVSFDNAEQKAYIITAYKPSLDIFEPDWKTRKKS